MNPDPPEGGRQALVSQLDESPITKRHYLQRAERLLGRVPGLKRVTLPALGIIVLITLVNAVV